MRGAASALCKELFAALLYRWPFGDAQALIVMKGLAAALHLNLSQINYVPPAKLESGGRRRNLLDDVKAPS